MYRLEKVKTLALGLTLSLGAVRPAPLGAQELREQFRAVSGSVVVVRTTERSPVLTAGARAVSAPGLGSGVLVSPDGKVLTAAHVVQTADRVAVEFPGGIVVPARVVASVPRADVALLQLQRVPAGARVATLADSDSLQVGDDVFIVGAPYGLSHTLSAGHVSGRHTFGRTIEGVPVEVLQTDAAVNVGNSGGPMFDMDGRVVGIVSRIVTRSGGFEGVGFAVSANVARALVLSRPSFWSGLDGFLLADTLARAFNVPQAAGLLIQQVAAGSPAAELGLRAGSVPATIDGEPLVVGGDVVLAVAGITITTEDATFDRIQDLLGRMRPGDTVGVTVLRGGRVVMLTGRARAW